MRPLTKLIVLVALTAVSGVGRAEGPSAAQVAQARAHFKQGAAFYNVGLYDRAIAEYQEAYELVPLPDLLFNLGQANRMRGDRAAAVTYYQKYLAAQPHGAAVDEARMHLTEMALAQEEEKKRAAEADAAAAAAKVEAAAKAEAAARAETAAREAAVRAGVAQAAADAQHTQVTATAPSRKPLVKRGWFWAVIGVSVVVVAGAVTAGVLLGSSTRNPDANLGRFPGN